VLYKIGNSPKAIQNQKFSLSSSGSSAAVWNQWTGLLNWNTGLEYWTGILEYWNGLNCYKKPFCDTTAF